ncbi:MAG: type II toxin-antitoxin system VapC family toxin [Betaproteobacteria bacterium]|nr:type II toxin-antitoxin system VapC family toxin [Betaproteobacteria bacterium]
MILYCDTSALIKLYLQEEASTAMLEHAAQAGMLAVCRIAWAEAMAGMARRARETPADAETLQAARQRLREHWPRYAVVELTQALVELAGDYADAFALRGYDSVQLAAARTLQIAAQEPVRFACFDARLRKAASVLGMTPIPA